MRKVPGSMPTAAGYPVTAGNTMDTSVRWPDAWLLRDEMLGRLVFDHNLSG